MTTELKRLMIKKCLTSLACDSISSSTYPSIISALFLSSGFKILQFLVGARFLMRGDWKIPELSGLLCFCYAFT